MGPFPSYRWDKLKKDAAGMAQSPGINLTGWRRTGNRLYAALAGLGGHPAVLRDLPGPRSIGSVQIGQDFIEGNFKFAGRLVMAPGASVWDIRAPDDAFLADMHGFGWLDHLMALASRTARQRAQLWVNEWIGSYGGGHGLAWAPEVAARRVMRWLHHYDDLVRRLPKGQRRLFDQSIARQSAYLRRRWKLASGALGRIEALAALALLRRVLEGRDGIRVDCGAAILKELDRVTDRTGAIASRSPEALLKLLNLCVWAQEDLLACKQPVSDEFASRIAAMGRLLRSLRHSDGRLARFQGGGSGAVYGLDQALAASGAKGLEPDGGMGFVRMASGRSSVIIDAAAPAKDAASFNAHASTLAFELTSGRRPVIVSCGAGAPFGPEWRKAGRATPSHSVLGLDGYSSSRLGRTREVMGQKREPMDSRPQDVPVHFERHLDYLRIEASHDGYLRSHGLLQGRALELTIDGSGIAGEEVLLSEGKTAQAQFDKVVDKMKGGGVPFTLRFHVHPSIEIRREPDMSGLLFDIGNGEVWAFRLDGTCKISVESSVYLEEEVLSPTATKQVVLSGAAMSYTTRVRWSLAKTPESRKGIRDMAGLEADQSV